MTNQDFEDDVNLQPTDAFQSAVESIQFEAPDQAGLKLRSAISTAMQDAEAKRKEDAESARSTEVLAEFRRRNAGLNDSVIEPSIERQALLEQARDLESVVDMKAWRDQLGREPNVQDIVSAHLRFRAHKAPNIRSTEEILESAATTVANKFGLRRQGKTDASAVILAKKNETRARRQLAPVEAGPISTDTDSATVSDTTAESFTTQMFGGDDSLPARDNHRTSSVQSMIDQRLALRGRKPSIYR
jgi:hypothetical protein